MTDIYLTQAQAEAATMPEQVDAYNVEIDAAVGLPFPIVDAEKERARVEAADPVDLVFNPGHYNSDRWPCQCRDFTRHMSFPAGNAFKYVWRHADKSTLVLDLDKAVEFLTWAQEDGTNVFSDMRVGYDHTVRRTKFVAEVDAAVAYAVERSRDVPTRAVYSALSLIVRREYHLAAMLIDNVQAK